MSIRLRQLCLVTENLGPVLEDLKQVLGLGVCFVDPGVATFGLENSLLPVGSNFLEVVAPTREGTAAGRYLQRRNGNGGYMVICQCDDHATQIERRKHALDRGIRIAFEHESPAYHILQLHPGDTGGSFLEIDWDAREEPEGHWEPAGGDGWTTAVHTGVVSEFLAVEIQSPDPQVLADRWSDIAGIPLRKDVQGRCELPLDNLPVRFVQASDGRPEGLGGIDLRVVDRDRLLRVASERGCRVSDEQLLICGTRFYLR